ncbi:hypothetical protein BC937DRAFT_92700 [Endogone sp. FLAS-F59071]|nr:hypothetical protein BC937DRAFT_92700 [Endogone sp. FLAS-F59071]|eukprot:RUS15245.1 hypothetical protein BC937DRAFT_92700 [Endogone sp. FLAS-F59071]
MVTRINLPMFQVIHPRRGEVSLHPVASSDKGGPRKESLPLLTRGEDRGGLHCLRGWFETEYFHQIQG